MLRLIVELRGSDLVRLVGVLKDIVDGDEVFDGTGHVTNFWTVVSRGSTIKEGPSVLTVENRHETVYLLMKRYIGLNQQEHRGVFSRAYARKEDFVNEHDYAELHSTCEKHPFFLLLINEEGKHLYRRYGHVGILFSDGTYKLTMHNLIVFPLNGHKQLRQGPNHCICCGRIRKCGCHRRNFACLRTCNCFFWA